MIQKNKIVVHCLVKNEDRFIWYALKSVLPYVDLIMVYDTGSTDNTVNLIRRINSKKIIFKEVGDVDLNRFNDIRNQMLKDTPKDCTWMMILDGDEVWPRRSIRLAAAYCRHHDDTDSIVVRTRNLVGDIYHSLPESAGRYRLAGHTGHLNLRFINLKAVPGLHVDKPHPDEAYFDSRGRKIQDRDPRRIKFLNLYYCHATHLHRSSLSPAAAPVLKRIKKYKIEIGRRLPVSQLPRIFFAPRPDLVPDVTAPAPPSFWFQAALLTPAKRLHRFLQALCA